MKISGQYWLLLISFFVSGAEKGAVLSSTSVLDGICSFNAQRDTEAIMTIARAEVPRLVSCYSFTQAEYDQCLKYDIGGALTSDGVLKKVRLYEGKSVGFIHYSVAPSWREFYMPEGKIWHLAIDRAYRNKGFGKELLNHAINHCKEEGSTRILLSTTPGTNLDGFYKKAGFVIKYRIKIWIKTLSI